MLNKLFFLTVIFYPLSFFAQDISYAKTIIDSLASQAMHGRGYVYNGQEKAAIFIKNEFINHGVLKLKDSYFQELSYSVNTFSDTQFLKINQSNLLPGVQFFASPYSASCKGNFNVLSLDKKTVTNKKRFDKFCRNNFSNCFVYLDNKGIDDKEILKTFESLKANPFNAKGIITREKDHLRWGVSKSAANFCVVQISDNIGIKKIKNITVNIKSKIIEKYNTQNVIGYIPGKLYPDSFILITCHYDHLGSFGPEAYIPGANDDASGVAIMLNLSNYYSKPENNSRYSLVFIAFTGEEIGLYGSKYFVENPLIPLKKISFLVNLDMVGTGDDGVMIVNGAQFPEYFNKFENINNQKKYFTILKKRGKSSNSDHFYFSENGVKSIFIYTLGGIGEYHNIYDKAETLPLTKYNELFSLIRDFIDDF